MIIFVIVYRIKKNSNEVNIFQPNFVKKNKNSYKIIYNNKILPLQTKLPVNDKSKKLVKIQLICYNDNLILNDLIKGSKTFYEIYPSGKYKNNVNKFYRLKLIQFNWSIMLYFAFEKKVKIFGKNFVKNNKEKCIFFL